ncbi:MAG: class D beta-lactamase [Rhizobiaceae bacterium]|nr:class D beta-lactamase [Rhizobiaceae bacterium]
MWQILRHGIAVAAVLTGAALPAPAAAQDFARHLAGIDAAFVLRNGATGETVRHAPKHAAKRFAPCSTFKIPNTAILLETGAAADLDAVVPYDPALKIANPAWARNLSLREAYRESALWVYRALSRKVEMAAIRRVLAAMDYGDGRTGKSIRDRPFWVDGTLKISADEQVAFLQRLHQGKAGLSERTARLTREAMVAEENPRWRLSAKTGSCRADGGGVNLWYVGYVERADTTHYFALHMSAADYQPLMDRRVPIARAILADLDVID